MVVQSARINPSGAKQAFLQWHRMPPVVCGIRMDDGEHVKRMKMYTYVCLQNKSNMSKNSSNGSLVQNNIQVIQLKEIND